VMSLLLVVIGLMAYSQLTLRELPNIDPPMVSVNVSATRARRRPWWKRA
jgi:multidrug efflux pump